MKKLIVKKGRPKVKERTESFTVSLKPSEKINIDKKYISLTKAIKTLL